MAFKTTLSFGINFLCSYSSELNQIQIMGPFWPKLSFYEKTLAFKGHEGQERLSNFLFLKFWQVKFSAKSFFFKKYAFFAKTKFEYGWVWGDLLYFSMAFLAIKGQIFFTKIFLIVNVGLGVNFIILLPLVFEIWRRSKIAPKAQCEWSEALRVSSAFDRCWNVEI